MVIYHMNPYPMVVLVPIPVVCEFKSILSGESKHVDRYVEKPIAILHVCDNYLI